MRKALLIVIVIFSLASIAFAQTTEKIIISAKTINIIDDKSGEQLMEVHRGAIFPLIATITAESIYKIGLGNNIYADIDISQANILKEDYSEEKLLRLNSKYSEDIINMSNIADLKDEFAYLKTKLEIDGYYIPMDYDLLKIPIILKVNKDYYFINNNNISEGNNRKTFYKNVRKYIVEALDNRYDIDPKNHSLILIEVLNDQIGYFSEDTKADLLLAKKAFELNPSKSIASVLIDKMAANPTEEDEYLIGKTIELLPSNSSSYTKVGLYYRGIKKYNEAIRYLKSAEEIVKQEKDEERALFELIGKAILAQLYEKIEDYGNAAIKYIELESKYGGYAFRAAYNAQKAKEIGINLPGIDYYKIIELYKRSNDPDGIYNAGLIYIEMGSPRNARLMAKILKNNYNRIEEANILLDDADKLDARLKGHNP